MTLLTMCTCLGRYSSGRFSGSIDSTLSIHLSKEGGIDHLLNLANLFAVLSQGDESRIFVGL